jgi:hypothetical protein
MNQFWTIAAIGLMLPPVLSAPAQAATLLFTNTLTADQEIAPNLSTSSATGSATGTLGQS